jgi:hypothetical protein
MTEEIGKKPEPTAEEPQLHPGGPDAADNPDYGETPEEPIVAGLPPEVNPAADEVPDEITEPDEKSQEPDNGQDQEAGTTDEGPSEPSG